MTRLNCSHLWGLKIWRIDATFQLKKTEATMISKSAAPPRSREALLKVVKGNWRMKSLILWPLILKVTLGYSTCMKPMKPLMIPIRSGRTTSSYSHTPKMMATYVWIKTNRTKLYLSFVYLWRKLAIPATHVCGKSKSSQFQKYLLSPTKRRGLKELIP